MKCFIDLTKKRNLAGRNLRKRTSGSGVGRAFTDRGCSQSQSFPGSVRKQGAVRGERNQEDHPSVRTIYERKNTTC